MPLAARLPCTPCRYNTPNLRFGFALAARYSFRWSTRTLSNGVFSAFAITQCLLHRKRDRSRGPSLRQGSVVLAIAGTMASSDSSIPASFRLSAAYLIPSLRDWLFRDGVEVSIVPLSSVHTSHPLYPGFLLWLRMVRSSTRVRGLRPRSKDSAEPPYTVLSQHDRTADIYEA